MFDVIVIIAVILAIAVALVLILAARKPNTFRVTRAAVVEAAPEMIFPLIADFQEWRKWSPWEGRDPAMKRTFSGAERGAGAVYAWDGNRNVGAGRMEITRAATPSDIVIKLDFIKPFEGHNIAEFTLSPQGSDTDVTWVMHGRAPFMSKVMQVFIDMDRMIGRDFEAGLANLKKVAER
jgi:hypothetical protein